MPINQRTWIRFATERLAADYARSADTHLIRLEQKASSDVSIYLKDESTHPSGSLKHRLARSLFLYGIANGWIREGRTVIEASSGSTAISEAYFASLVRVPFIAVVPANTATKKTAAIEFYGGRVEKVSDAAGMEHRCRELAAQLDGHFIDQFTFAERATDWRGNNNIAESLFAQMAQERNPIPDWIIVGAGTGGTSATIGRYIRYRPELAARTRLCVVDPRGSAYFPSFRDLDPLSTGACSAVVEGIGRPRVEASFIPSVIDCMVSVPDAASVAACLWLESRIGRRVGPSTGTNLIGTLILAEQLAGARRGGSLVSLICDGGDRYSDTIYDPSWRALQDLDLSHWSARFQQYERTGRFELRGEDSKHTGVAICDRSMVEDDPLFDI
ncbi:MAG TPA: PLP-dependent cysteine synthase family protein [Steroidobacteraceae bacterium]|nr:PLP-dependent cysteine synthase family protein [Steroidobacteraceae bacterium]